MAVLHKRMLRVADVILIAVLLLSAGVLFVRQAARPVGVSATVERGGHVLYVIDLTDTTRRSFTVDGEYPLTVITEGGAVWVEDAACPDHWCERSGKLTKGGETAACIPAGVLLRVDGAVQSTDGVTG